MTQNHSVTTNSAPVLSKSSSSSSSNSSPVRSPRHKGPTTTSSSSSGSPQHTASESLKRQHPPTGDPSASESATAAVVPTATNNSNNNCDDDNNDNLALNNCNYDTNNKNNNSTYNIDNNTYSDSRRTITPKDNDAPPPQHGMNNEGTVTSEPMSSQIVDGTRRRNVTAIATIAGGDCDPSDGAHIANDNAPEKVALQDPVTDPPPPPVELRQWNDMPRYLQFNPYVLTGYRPLQTVSGCLSSLFYLHNETINILTHGIPIVYILATVPAKLMWSDHQFLSWCHILGSVAPWCGSFVYHLFMNLDRGENLYYKLLKLDMFGIWISQSIGAIPMVTATVYCLNWHLKWLIILTYSMLSLWGLYKAMCATSPWQRRLCFLLPFTMRVLLTLLRLTRFGGGNNTSMTHVFLQDAVSVVGGAIGAMHIPEKWFPGSMDYYLNSHNIMHVLVVVAVYSMHQATVQDLDWMSKTECFLRNSTTVPTEPLSAAAASMLSPLLGASSNTEL